MLHLQLKDPEILAVEEEEEEEEEECQAYLDPKQACLSLRRPLKNGRMLLKLKSHSSTVPNH